MAKDLSIEYAHIYTKNKISDEQELSLDILSGLTKEMAKNNKSHSLVVLVDDYSFPDPSFDYDEFTTWLKDRGFPADLIIRESQLIPVCDQVLREIKDNKLRASIQDYITSKKYPCSLFIAAWYLVRLGRLQSSIFPSELVGSKLVNILPKSFKSFEDKAVEILKSTKFSNVIDVIENKYFEGRLIA